MLDVLEQEGLKGRRRPGGVLVDFVDMRVDEALRPADAVLARDKAALRELSGLDAIRRGDARIKRLPLRLNWDLRPEARVATRLSALRVSSRASPITLAAATVAPKAPVVAV